MTASNRDIIRSIEWIGDLDGCVRILDQTCLPETQVFLDCSDVETVWEAIKALRVRGAPAIGIAAAMGLVLAIRDVPDDDPAAFDRRIEEASKYLAASRPTAVNLFWALKRMGDVIDRQAEASVAVRKALLLAEARLIRDEDARMCRAIGREGEALIPEGAGVLTHCNAGGLATAEYGTALAPIFTAHAQGRRPRVFADETRPLLQGSRLTAWELQQAGVDVTVICDSMAAQVMQAGEIDLVITGADRIVANGDVANKIGTYGLAVLARAHEIPFYVAAPSSTFDLQTATGKDIPIELRSDTEIRQGFGKQTVPDNVKCHCPAFDVTPAHLISAIVTERGMIRNPNADRIQALLSAPAGCSDS